MSTYLLSPDYQNLLPSLIITFRSHCTSTFMLFNNSKGNYLSFELLYGSSISHGNSLVASTLNFLYWVYHCLYSNCIFPRQLWHKNFPNIILYSSCVKLKDSSINLFCIFSTPAAATSKCYISSICLLSTNWLDIFTFTWS